MRQIKGFTLFMLIIILSSLFITVNCGKKEKIQIVLISIDTLRGDHITPYGYPLDTTPHLTKLVKDSVYYPNGYANGCWTMPSHISILTGTLPSRHGVNEDLNRFIQKKYPKLHHSIKTISEVLKSCNRNIKTVKFAKLSNELGFNRGFDINNIVDPFARDENFNKLLKELENHKEENFFFFIHTWMVHAPYTHSYFLEKGKIDDKKRSIIDDFRNLNKKERSKILGREAKATSSDFVDFLRKNKLFNANDCAALYDSGIRYVDRYIGEFIKKSRQLDIYDNVMFIVVSDHGEHFGERKRKKHMFYDYHGHYYYEEFIKVPIIIKYPQRFRRKILHQPVSLIDVVPTLLDYYSIKTPVFVQGESLLKPYAKRDRKYLVSEAITRPGIERKMIMAGYLKYIVTMKKPNKAGRVNWDEITERELFDLKKDPLEKKNLYKQREFRHTALKLEKMLKKVLEKSIGNYGSSEDAKVGKEILEHMKSLGYVGH